MGFFRVENRVIDEGIFTTTQEMAVYMVINRFNNREEQYAFPSLDFFAEKCRCSRKTVLKAVRTMERKGLLQVERVEGRNNRYLIKRSGSDTLPSSQNTQGSVSGLLDKEQSINNNKKESLTRGEVLKEIHKLISEATGAELFRVEQGFHGAGKSLEILLGLRERIKYSDFLLGRKVKKPELWHFSKTETILSGYYDNSDGKSQPLPSYYQEFPETGVTYYEPLD